MASKRDRLSNKIGRAINKLQKQFSKTDEHSKDEKQKEKENKQIEDLKNIGKQQSNIQKYLKKQTPELQKEIEKQSKELTITLSDYAIKYGVNDIEEFVKIEEFVIKFDPVAQKWVKPNDMDLWNKFIEGYKRSKGKMTQTYAEFEEKALTKAKKEATSKIPIDVTDNSQLQALWGSKSLIDKSERVQAIVKMFQDNGYKVTNIQESSRSSAKDNPPVLFDIVGHPMISKFEIHPGKGIHKAPYIRISTQIGMIKIINKNSNPPYDKLTEANVKYVEVSK